MPNKSEKHRRKGIVHAQRDQQRSAFRDNLPAPVHTLKALFDFVDRRLSNDACDHTLRFTHEFIEQHAIDDRVIAWLKANDGYCDCEALGNVEPIVTDAFPGYEQLGNETRGAN